MVFALGWSWQRRGPASAGSIPWGLPSTPQRFGTVTSGESPRRRNDDENVRRSSTARATDVAGPGLSRWVRLKSLVPDRVPYAAVVFVSVVDEGGHNQLFHCHRGCVREEYPALRQLLVAEAADHGSCHGRTLSMERERLLFGAASKILRVLSVPFVEHLSREVAERLSSRESCGDVWYPFIRRRKVMRRHADGPLLRFRDLLPVRGGDSLEYMGGFLGLGLELPGECFPLYSMASSLVWASFNSRTGSLEIDRLFNWTWRGAEGFRPIRPSGRYLTGASVSWRTVSRPIAGCRLSARSGRSGRSANSWTRIAATREFWLKAICVLASCSAATPHRRLALIVFLRGG